MPARDRPPLLPWLLAAATAACIAVASWTLYSAARGPAAIKVDPAFERGGAADFRGGRGRRTVTEPAPEAENR